MSSSDDTYTGTDAVEDGTDGVSDYGVGGYAQRSVIGGALAALGVAISSFLLAIQGTLFAPIRAFSEGVATFLGGTIGAPVVITDAGAQASAQSFLTGAAASLGPFAFPVAVMSSVAGVGIFLYAVSRLSFSPLNIFTNEDG